MAIDNLAGRRLSRRDLLISGTVAIAVAIPGVTLAGPWLMRTGGIAGPARGSFVERALSVRRRRLSFYNIHTHESLTTTYFADGKYQPAGLRAVNYFFRDFRTHLLKSIDPHLLDLLYEIRLKLKTGRPFDLISGYRSPATNAMLVSRSKGVSPHSLHMQGRAADIDVPGVDLSYLHQIALALKAGGVGYYPQSNFIHVDTGRVRHWQFDPG